MKNSEKQIKTSNSQTTFKAKYLADSDPLALIQDKIYDVLSVEGDGEWYRVIDETGEDYLYPAFCFEKI